MYSGPAGRNSPTKGRPPPGAFVAGAGVANRRNSREMMHSNNAGYENSPTYAYVYKLIHSIDQSTKTTIPTYHTANRVPLSLGLVHIELCPTDLLNPQTPKIWHLQGQDLSKDIDKLVARLLSHQIPAPLHLASQDPTISITTPKTSTSPTSWRGSEWKPQPPHQEGPFTHNHNHMTDTKDREDIKEDIHHSNTSRMEVHEVYVDTTSDILNLPFVVLPLHFACHSPSPITVLAPLSCVIPYYSIYSWGSSNTFLSRAVKLSSESEDFGSGFFPVFLFESRAIHK